ncbi:MAG: polyprenol monophosphomannose synthase [Micrococcales bacterium]|nr:polyprenol monophosphomannose synthase [Micrococcales bacterium]
MSAPHQPRVLVVVPTYDEVQSLEPTVRGLLAAAPEVDVLVADDASPDGTGELADRLAAADSRISVLHRPIKDGLGRAYLAGFAWAAERGYDVVVEMDADGSHPASALPSLLDALAADARCGVAIGSRWVSGGRVVDWPLPRRLLSRGANSYARILLGAPVRDLTAGFRAYRASALAGLDLDSVDSRGYCFQIDMTLRILDAGWGAREVPITFRDRVHGTSKMTGGIVGEAMRRVTLWGLQRRRLRRRTR